MGGLTGQDEMELRRLLGRLFGSGGSDPRIDAILLQSDHDEVPLDATLHFEDLSIDPVSREVESGDQLIDLTAKEFDLLMFIASSPRQVFSRQELLAQVWSSCAEWQDEATVTEHVRRVRLKIEVDPSHPLCISTVRGVGYKFVPPPAGQAQERRRSRPEGHLGP